MASVHSGHTGGTWGIAPGALEVYTSETTVTTAHTLRFGQEREVAVLLASDTIGGRVYASLAVRITLYTKEGGVSIEGVWALIIAPALIVILELAVCRDVTLSANLGTSALCTLCRAPPAREGSIIIEANWTVL